MASFRYLCLTRVNKERSLERDKGNDLINNNNWEYLYYSMSQWSPNIRIGDVKLGITTQRSIARRLSSDAHHTLFKFELTLGSIKNFL